MGESSVHQISWSQNTKWRKTSATKHQDHFHFKGWGLGFGVWGLGLEFTDLDGTWEDMDVEAQVITKSVLEWLRKWMRIMKEGVEEGMWLYDGLGVF